MKTAIATVPAAALTPLEMQSVIAVKTEIEEFIVGLRSVPIVTPAEIDIAGRYLSDYTEQSKTLEKRRVSLTEPINTMLKSVNGVFNPTIKALKSATDQLRSRMSDAQSAINERNRELVRQQAALIAASQPQAAAIVHSSMAVVPVLEGIKAREEAKAEVVDADKVPMPFCSPDIRKILHAVVSGTFEVPRILCSPDPEKIQAALKLLGDRLDIPGVAVSIGSKFSVLTKKA